MSSSQKSSGETQQTQQTQTTQQLMVPPPDPWEQMARQAAVEAELFRHFLGQRLAAETFESPLVSPLAQQGFEEINRQYRDERDLRGLGGDIMSSSGGGIGGIGTARAQALGDFTARLQDQAIRQRMALLGNLGVTPGGLGMQALAQQGRIAGAPFQSTSMGTGTGMSQTQGSGMDWASLMGGGGNLFTGIGNLYSAFGTPQPTTNPIF